MIEFLATLGGVFIVLLAVGTLFGWIDWRG